VFRIFNCDSILPLLAVITEPQLHTISLFMQLGSLYHVLHDLDSGEQAKPGLDEFRVVKSCLFPHSPSCVLEVKINLVEGVQFARGICHGMAYLHNLDPIIAGFELNPFCVMVRSEKIS